ncbi:MAG: TIGR00730 family Rossman fold protein [Clostridia bacterium]|nr:TIGR00730 family Rossman fold protein [Clostridia bacterium]
MKVCVYGSASDLIDPKYVKACFELGEKLALAGDTLIFGGGAHGVMGASARGFKKHGGKIIGIVPEFFRQTFAETLFTESDETHWVDTMYTRKRLMEETSDAFVIAPGGIGTYDEFFSVLVTKQLMQHSKPIAFFSPYGFYNGMDGVFDDAVKKGFIKKGCLEMFHIFADADDLIGYIHSDKPYEYLKYGSVFKDG